MHQPDLRHLTDQYELTDAELAATLDAVMASHAAGEDMWVFGYGSLMWRPGFAWRERCQGVVHGFHRALCIYSHIWRGTRDRPGLVLGLDNGGACRGVAYRVAAGNARAVADRLIRREMVTRVYTPRWVAVRLDDGRRVRAHTYTAAHNHTQYAGKLAPAAAAELVRHGVGRGGANVDYLASTIAHLDELGIADGPLHRLQALVSGSDRD